MAAVLPSSLLELLFVCGEGEKMGGGTSLLNQAKEQQQQRLVLKIAPLQQKFYTF